MEGMNEFLRASSVSPGSEVLIFTCTYFLKKGSPTQHLEKSESWLEKNKLSGAFLIIIKLLL